MAFITPDSDKDPADYTLSSKATITSPEDSLKNGDITQDEYNQIKQKQSSGFTIPDSDKDTVASSQPQSIGQQVISGLKSNLTGPGIYQNIKKIPSAVLGASGAVTGAVEAPFQNNDKPLLENLTNGISKGFQNNYQDAMNGKNIQGVLSDPITDALSIGSGGMSTLESIGANALGQGISTYLNDGSVDPAAFKSIGVSTAGGALAGGLGKLAQYGLGKVSNAAGEWLTKYKNLKNLPEGLGDLTESDLTQMSKMQAESIPELLQDHTYISPDATKIPSMGSQTLEQYMDPGSFATQYIFGKGPTKVSEVALAHLLGGAGYSIPLAGVMAADYAFPKLIPTVSESAGPIAAKTIPSLAPLFSNLISQNIGNKLRQDKGNPLQ